MLARSPALPLSPWWQSGWGTQPTGRVGAPLPLVPPPSPSTILPVRSSPSAVPAFVLRWSPVCCLCSLPHSQRGPAVLGREGVGGAGLCALRELPGGLGGGHVDEEIGTWADGFSVKGSQGPLRDPEHTPHAAGGAGCACARRVRAHTRSQKWEVLCLP